MGEKFKNFAEEAGLSMKNAERIQKLLNLEL